MQPYLFFPLSPALETMDPAVDRPRLRIIIIGAGICGLGSAISIALATYDVTVLESAPGLHQVGAGIQITPNGSRCLRRWGVLHEILRKASCPDILSIFRYDGRKVLAQRHNYSSELQARYGETSFCVHRKDLQEILARRARELGVQIFFNRRTTKVDFANGAITCTDNSIERGDLVIAADGLWSSMRD